MSCETNALKAKAAGMAAGVSSLASKSAYNAAALGSAAAGRASPLVEGAGKKAAQVRDGVAGVTGAMTARTKAAASVVGRGASAAKAKVQQVADWEAEREYQLAARVAPASNKVLAVASWADRFKVGGMAINAGLFLLARRYGVKSAQLHKLKQLSDRLSSGVQQGTGQVGNAVTSLSRKSLAASVVQEKPVLYFFKKKTTVQLWNSSLTPLLNRQDRLGPAGSVRSSKGALLTVNGVAWHQGTTVVNHAGDQRTITHLQSLSYPAAHYYFDRPLSVRETAGIVSGQPGFNPERMTGYVGQVTSTESLALGWAKAKHGLIKNRLYFPPPDAQSGARPPRNGQRYPPRPQDFERAEKKARGEMKKVGEILE